MIKVDYNKHIAERVMGWELNGTVYILDELRHFINASKYNPYDNDSQAIEALREFGVVARFAWFPEGNFWSVGIGGWLDEHCAEDPQLSVAICKALFAATKEAE